MNDERIIWRVIRNLFDEFFEGGQTKKTKNTPIIRLNLMILLNQSDHIEYRIGGYKNVNITQYYLSKGLRADYSKLPVIRVTDSFFVG